MSKLGGHYPELEYEVTVLGSSGFLEVPCTLFNVPFFGHYGPGGASVGILWDDDDLAFYAEEAQEWCNVLVVTSIDGQRLRIEAALNALLGEESIEEWVIE